MIRCGWCGHPTVAGQSCTSCGHIDPTRPWAQRGLEPPEVRTDVVGRPALDPTVIRRRLRDARAALGDGATVEQLAEYLSVSPKTVRRWREMTR